MKPIFGCLLCLVVTVSQTVAQDIGSLFGTGGNTIAVTGNYAGVFMPLESSPDQNSIGLFTITIPTTGFGSGDVLIFAEGKTYSGTFTGITDPDSAKLVGEIDASFTPVSITGTGGSTIEIKTDIAAGRLNAQLFQNTNIFSTATVRMTGSAEIEFSNTATSERKNILYDVIGFKQSDVS